MRQRLCVFVLVFFLSSLVSAMDADPDFVLPEDGSVAEVLTQASTKTPQHVTPQVVSLTQIPAHVFHQAASEMSVLLQQQGDAACRDLANAATAEVNAAVDSRQKILDSMPNGSQCENEGQQNIVAARNAKNVADAAVQAAQKAESDLRNQPFDLIGLTLAGITEGNCDPLFKSDVWLKQKSALQSAVTLTTKLKTDANAAQAVLDAAIANAVGLVKSCKCVTKKALDTALDQSNSNSKSADTLAWTRAASLTCALDGKDAKSCVVPPLPTCKAPIYASGVAESCGEVLRNDSCGGFRISTTCGSSRVAFELIDSNGIFDQTKAYLCNREGWYWATTDEYFALTRSNGCFDNNGASYADSGVNAPAYNARCGWGGYPTSSTGSNAMYAFAFSDSIKTNNYQHAGNYVGYKDTNFNGQYKNQLAGIICMKK